MTRTEIARDLRQFTGAGVITPKQLAAYLGVKTVWRVREKYLSGLEHLGNAYLITEVAARMKEEMEV